MQTGVQGMEFHDHAEHLGEPQQEELDLQSAGSSPYLTFYTDENHDLAIARSSSSRADPGLSGI